MTVRFYVQLAGPPLASLGALLLCLWTRASRGCCVHENPTTPRWGRCFCPWGSLRPDPAPPADFAVCRFGGSGFLPCLTAVEFRWPSASPINPAAFPSRSLSPVLQHPVFYSHKIAMRSGDIPVRSYAAHTQQISCQQIVPHLCPPKTVPIPVTRHTQTLVGIQN